jgi:hypothetical protein
MEGKEKQHIKIKEILRFHGSENGDDDLGFDAV